MTKYPRDYSQSRAPVHIGVRLAEGVWLYEGRARGAAQCFGPSRPEQRGADERGRNCLILLNFHQKGAYQYDDAGRNFTKS